MIIRTQNQLEKYLQTANTETIMSMVSVCMEGDNPKKYNNIIFYALDTQNLTALKCLGKHQDAALRLVLESPEYLSHKEKVGIQTGLLADLVTCPSLSIYIEIEARRAFPDAVIPVEALFNWAVQWYFASIAPYSDGLGKVVDSYFHYNDNEKYSAFLGRLLKSAALKDKNLDLKGLLCCKHATVHELQADLPLLSDRVFELIINHETYDPRYPYQWVHPVTKVTEIIFLHDRIIKNILHEPIDCFGLNLSKVSALHKSAQIPLPVSLTSGEVMIPIWKRFLQYVDAVEKAVGSDYYRLTRNYFKYKTYGLGVINMLIGDPRISLSFKDEDRLSLGDHVHRYLIRTVPAQQLDAMLPHEGPQEDIRGRFSTSRLCEAILFTFMSAKARVLQAADAMSRYITSNSSSLTELKIERLLKSNSYFIDHVSHMLACVLYVITHLRQEAARTIHRYENSLDSPDSAEKEEALRSVRLLRPNLPIEIWEIIAGIRQVEGAKPIEQPWDERWDKPLFHYNSHTVREHEAMRQAIQGRATVKMEAMLQMNGMSRRQLDYVLKCTPR